MNSMYLSTLSQPKKKFSKPSFSLTTNDIDGARPRFYDALPIATRESNRTADIDGSRSKQIIPDKELRKSMHSKDIYGTQPSCNKFKTTRQTNPLDPAYQLQEVVLLPVEQSKFIRDTLEIDDIEGTRIKQNHVRKMVWKNQFSETKLTQTDAWQHKRPRTISRNQNFHLKTQDINLKPETHFRETNPLDPRYNLQGAKYGEIPDSRPTPSKNPSVVRPNNNLNVSDINWKRQNITAQSVRKPEKYTEEYQSKAPKGNLTTKRCVNPLNPSYKYPGWSDPSCQPIMRPKTAHQKIDAFLKG